jgi:hypothetical protein
MYATFVRIMTTIAFAMTLLTPLNASADPLSPAQMSSLSASTGAYFRALYKLDYPALTEMATPDFVIVKNGKSFGSKPADQIQTAKLTVNDVSGRIRIDSASSIGGTVTEVVSLNIQGQVAGDANDASGRTSTSSHQLTWIKSATGKWLLAKDVILSSSLGT